MRAKKKGAVGITLVLVALQKGKEEERGREGSKKPGCTYDMANVLASSVIM